MNQFTRKSIWTALTAAALFMITLGIAPNVSTAQSEQLSHKEVRELIANAKEPQDHLRLARYFNSEADRLEAIATEHQEMAQSYRDNTTSQAAAMKNPAGPNTVAHCEFFVKSMRDAAKSDRELATEHEQMSKDAAKPGK